MATVVVVATMPLAVPGGSGGGATSGGGFPGDGDADHERTAKGSRNKSK